MLTMLRRFLGFAPRDGVEPQFGAIPWRRRGGAREFLLVTSRRTGRWIFPKGGRIAWLSARDCAAQEAYEEAGVEGIVAPEPAGRYRATKIRPEGSHEIEVEMYPLEVEMEFDDWPEKKQRRRRWASFDEACILLSEPGVVEVLRGFAGVASVAGSGAGAPPGKPKEGTP
jgi:8-oxo-dGTP pyrophosphatase MutT (NUDIX family)